jgi:hypothetical protein
MFPEPLERDMAEMTIPRTRSQRASVIALTLFSFVFSVLAVVDLLNGDALIASMTWLSLMAVVVSMRAHAEGGLAAYARDLLGEAFGRHFVQTKEGGLPSSEPLIGYDLCRRRFIRRVFTVDRLQKVEWSPGQATDMAGRYMRDWHVFFWYDDNDRVKTEARRKWLPTPELDIYAVSQSQPREDTERLGQEFVALLRSAGLPLIAGKNEQTFVRALQRTG